MSQPTDAKRPTPGQRLRTLLDAGCVAMPGAFNALVARAIASAGFDACYFSGGATSAANGVPDVGLLTLDHFATEIRKVADASGLPVLADADTGFGEEEMVRRTVIEYARAGAAALHLEDQQFPKRCGHLDGKSLIPVEHSASKIRWAAKAAKESADPAFIVCARTDAAGVEGFDAAVGRAFAYAEAGAEMIFPEGLQSEAEFARFAEAMGELERPPYLLANMTEFGKTPMLPLSKFEAMGYACVIYPVTTLRIAMGAVERALAVLKEQGTAEPLLDEMQSRKGLYELLGYTPGTPWEFPGRS
ncbi:MAG: methylisocitrate lyase [Phycisphaerales bacterium]|nr:MAG: methylisocitrate lyase [Phycisphaerales bacterium]